MNTKNIIIVLLTLTILGLVLSQYHNDTTMDHELTTSLDKEKSELIERVKIIDKKPLPKLDDTLLALAEMITPPSDELLKISWKDEYTCIDADKCEKDIFNARSYEDAMWLKRKGYPSRSMMALLPELSKSDLHKLSNHENINAKNLLAVNALFRQNYKKARSYAGSSAAYTSYTGSRETFAYRVLAQAHLLDNDPMVATLYLRMAAILGDTNAEATYENITARTASPVIDNTNRIAFSYLTETLNTNINNLNNDPRPTDNGEGGL